MYPSLAVTLQAENEKLKLNLSRSQSIIGQLESESNIMWTALYCIQMFEAETEECKKIAHEAMKKIKDYQA